MVGAFFFFFNAAGSGSRCHSSEQDWRWGRETSRKTGEEYTEASVPQQEGRSGAEEEGREKKLEKKRGPCLSREASPIFPGPLEAATAPGTGLPGPK